MVRQVKQEWGRGPRDKQESSPALPFYSYSCLVSLENSAPVGRHSAPGFIKIADDSV